MKTKSKKQEQEIKVDSSVILGRLLHKNSSKTIKVNEKLKVRVYTEYELGEVIGKLDEPVYGLKHFLHKKEVLISHSTLFKVFELLKN